MLTEESSTAVHHRRDDHIISETQSAALHSGAQQGNMSTGAEQVLLTPEHDHYHRQHKALLPYIPALFRYDVTIPMEATGLALDAYGRGAVVMSSLFLGPALLQLATQAAGCDPLDQDTCTNKIYGFRPSSLLTNIAIFAGLASAVGLPLIGAMIDHTKYRRIMGVLSAIGLVIVKAVEISVGPNTWFFVAFLQVVSSFLYDIHNTAAYAYLSELSTDGEKQTMYNTYYYIVYYIATLLFLLQVLLISHLSGVGDVGTARISQVLSSITAAIFFSLAWRFFRPRPALSEVPPGQTLLTSGFRKLQRTFAVTIRQSSLRFLIGAVIFGEAATTALVTISTTYMTQLLQMNANEIGVVFLIVIVTGIPGSKAGEYLALKLRNPVRSAILCDWTFVVTTSLAIFVLTGPETKQYSYIFAVFWGIGLGWQQPMHSTAYISMIPKGSEAELMSLYLVSGQLLSWLPPLVFTALNEAGFSMSIGFWSVNIFLLIAILFLHAVGDYHRAVARAQSQGTTMDPSETSLVDLSRNVL